MIIAVLINIMKEGSRDLEMGPGRTLFARGQDHAYFYSLLEGELTVVINSVSLEVRGPALVGDYEI